MATHLNKNQIINQGSFYTPPFIAQMLYQMLLASKIALKNYILLDSSCGDGNFLAIPKKLQSAEFMKIIGADIDEIALEKAQIKMADSNISFFHTNSLQNVNRKKFQILESDKLIIIGNPPYNDKTSIVQNRLKNIDSFPIDSNLKARAILALAFCARLMN